MIKELSKIKDGERSVIDIEKHYKKNEVFFEMNEAKLHSPIILVDPTNKERNALASLSKETFKKFQKSAKGFLKRPNRKFFIKEEIDKEKLEKEAKKKKAEFLHLVLETDKQAGDIAGTKLRKFSEFLIKEFDNYFTVLKDEFEYGGMNSADLYLILRSRKEIIRIGPPLHMKKYVNKFKKEHMNTYEKNNYIHAKIKIKFDAKSYLDVWKKSNKKVMLNMGITKIN